MQQIFYCNFLSFLERDTIKKLATDAMFKLEHGVNDKSKIKNRIPGLNELAELQSVKKDDYMINKLARKKFRVSISLVK